MRIEVTRQGVMLDQLCFEVLGFDNAGVVERTLDLNPSLAAVLRANAHVLPLGTVLNLPEPGEIAITDTTIKLWD